MKKVSLLLLLCACETPTLGAPTATATAIDIIEIQQFTGIVSFGCIPSQAVDLENFDPERDLRVLIDISATRKVKSCADIKATNAGLSGAQVGDSIAIEANADGTLCEVRRDPGDGAVFMNLRTNGGCFEGSFEVVDFQFPNETTVIFEYVTLLQ